jgi:hypothetical protein
VATALLDIDACGLVDFSPLGVVAVRHPGFANSTAVCSCGWSGRRRHLMAAAEQDAWVHAMHSGCAVSNPLVFG